jgi:hypothetical protein
MAQPAANIDEIVRQVVAELTARQPVDPADVATGTETQIVGQVITTSQFVGIARDTTVRVAETAVITPSARDLAVERNIRIEKGCHANLDGPATQTLFLCTNQVVCQAETLVRLLQRDGITVNQTDNKCVIEAVRQSISALDGRPCGAVLLTTKTAVAVCLANRTGTVRAVTASSVSDLHNALTDIAPNMLIVNPAGIGVAALKSMISRFCQSSAEQPAEPYRAALTAKGT